MSSLLCVSIFSGVANAAWIWTPETKKFTNPKNAVKDTPKEQFEWAMSFYNSKDYQRGAFEFDKLSKQYEFSDYASKAQYYVGLCYENLQKYYTAYENYQKAIDNFPHLSNTDEVLAREYAIGLLYLEKPSPKVMGTDIMAPLDRAAEIFKKVVDNAPYGKYAEDAQFKLAETLKKSERYEEAIQAYHKMSEDYPNSKYATQAMYEESNCAYRASLKPAYDATATDNAIKTFEKFANKNKDAELAHKADGTMKRLKDNVAQKSFDVAKFYESQGKTEAAIIYYQDVIDNYPESLFVNEAKAKIEALKNKPSKAAVSPINFDKKKPKSLTDQSEKKLSWNLFQWPGKKQEKKQATQEPSKKKGWRPFSFEEKRQVQQVPPAAQAPKSEIKTEIVETPKAEQAPPATPVTQAPSVEPVTPAAETMAQTTEAPKTEPTIQVAEAPKVEAPKQEAPAPQVQETPKKENLPAGKQGWNPFNFENKKEKKAEPVEKKPVEKKPWKPFEFFGSKKTEAPAPQVQEAPKKKAWTPFKFEDKKEKKAEPVETKPVEKKPWKPFNFSRKQEAPAVEAPKAEPAIPVIPAIRAPETEIQKPEAAEPETVPVTQVVQKIKIEEDGQVVESTKTAPIVPESENKK